MIALAFSCDVLGCDTRVTTAEPFTDVGFGGGVYVGHYGPGGGWIDGTFKLPDGWKVDATGKYVCPEHADVKL